MNLAWLLVSLSAGIIQGIPGISATIKQVISNISASLSAVASSGVTTNLNASTVLAALAGVIVALKADPNLPADKLSVIAGLEDAITAALAADAQAQKLVDPTQLKPINQFP